MRGGNQGTCRTYRRSKIYRDDDKSDEGLIAAGRRYYLPRKTTRKEKSHSIEYDELTFGALNMTSHLKSDPCRVRLR